MRKVAILIVVLYASFLFALVPLMEVLNVISVKINIDQCIKTSANLSAILGADEESIKYIDENLRVGTSDTYKQLFIENMRQLLQLDSRFEAPQDSPAGIIAVDITEVSLVAGTTNSFNVSMDVRFKYASEQLNDLITRGVLSPRSYTLTRTVTMRHVN